MRILADARTIPLQSGTVQCVVTSPPYWGLRDYGIGGQLGLEPTPDAYVAALVGVFREVWRVLRDDGTLWLNLGSSYGSKGGDTHSGFNERYFGKPSVTDKQSMTPFPDCDGKRASQSRQPSRAPAYGSDGRAPQDSTGADSACSDLCDGCLADFLSHHAGIAGSDPQTGQYEPQPSLTGRDIWPQDSASLTLAASPLSAQVSTTLQSWRQHRGECSRCASRASALSSMRSSSPDAPVSAGMTWLNYTSKLKQKDLVPIPWIVAMALQSDGWYLRSDIIWAKPNPMPESVTDRPTKAHEYVFLLTKRERYYWDADAVREPQKDSTLARYAYGFNVVNETQPNLAKYTKGNGQDGGTISPINGGANIKTVWTITTQPYAEAHFATMPEKLAERCILAGSKPGDLVLDPFGGSGTTVKVARSLNRRGVMLDLNPAYLDLAKQRNANLQPSLLETEASA